MNSPRLLTPRLGSLLFGRQIFGARALSAAATFGVVFSVLCEPQAARAQTIYDWLDTAPDGYWRMGSDGARWSGGYWNEPPFGVLRFNNNHFPTTR